MREKVKGFGYLKFTTIAVLLSMLLVGCGLYGYNPGPPPDPKYNYNFAGDWIGTLEEQTSNPRTAQVTVTINPHNYSETIDTNDYSSGYYSLRGNWKAEYSKALSSVGILEGSASAYDADFFVELTFGDDPNCVISVQAVRVENTITGTFKPGASFNNFAPIPVNTENCSFTDLKAGNFQIKKQ